MAKPIPIPIPIISPRRAAVIVTPDFAQIHPTYRNPLVRVEPPTPIACSLPGRLRYKKEEERQDSWGAESGVSVHDNSVPCMFETDTESIVGKLQETFQESMQCLMNRGHLQGIGLDQIQISFILGTSLTPFPTGEEEEKAIYHRKQDQRRKSEEITVSPEAWSVLRYWAKEKHDTTGEVMVVQVKIIVPPPAVISVEIIRPASSGSNRLSVASSQRPRWILPSTTLRTDSPGPLGSDEPPPSPENTYICIGCSGYFDISGVTDGSDISEHISLEEREVGEEAGWYCFVCLSRAYRELKRDMTALRRGETLMEHRHHTQSQPADNDPDSMKAAIERGIKILDRISVEQLEDIEEESDQDDTPKPSRLKTDNPVQPETGTATPESEATAIDLGDADLYKPVTTATTASDRFMADESHPFSRRMTPPDAIPSTLLWVKTPVDKLSPRMLTRALDDAAKVHGEKAVYRESVVVKPMQEGGSKG